MTAASKPRCGDCGTDVSAGALIVSTVVGPNVLETLCCPDPDGECMYGFLRRASAALHAPVERHGHGYAEVFVDDDHFVKISPSFGPIPTTPEA